MDSNLIASITGCCVSQRFIQRIELSFIGIIVWSIICLLLEAGIWYFSGYFGTWLLHLQIQMMAYISPILKSKWKTAPFGEVGLASSYPSSTRLFWPAFNHFGFLAWWSLTLLQSQLPIFNLSSCWDVIRFVLSVEVKNGRCSAIECLGYKSWILRMAYQKRILCKDDCECHCVDVFMWLCCSGGNSGRRSGLLSMEQKSCTWRRNQL